MYVVYADTEGNIYEHEQWTALARSGDMIVELYEDELIPLPEGAPLSACRVPVQ